MDKIKVYVNGNDKISGIMTKNKTQILSEVMAEDMITGSTEGYTKEWNINGEDVTLGVQK